MHQCNVISVSAGGTLMNVIELGTIDVIKLGKRRIEIVAIILSYSHTYGTAEVRGRIRTETGLTLLVVHTSTHQLTPSDQD